MTTTTTTTVKAAVVGQRHRKSPTASASAGGGTRPGSVWQNGKSQRLGNDVIAKGAHIVRIIWLHCRSHLRKAGAGGDGARAHQLVPGEDAAIFPTNTMVSNVDVHAAAQKLDRTSDGGTMWLSKDQHDAIMAHPMELTP